MHLSHKEQQRLAAAWETELRDRLAGNVIDIKDLRIFISGQCVRIDAEFNSVVDGWRSASVIITRRDIEPDDWAVALVVENIKLQLNFLNRRDTRYCIFCGHDFGYERDTFIPCETCEAQRQLAPLLAEKDAEIERLTKLLEERSHLPPDEHRAVHPLSEAQKNRVRELYQRGEPLCCRTGKHNLLQIINDVVWVEYINDWAYERLGCSSAWKPGGESWDAGKVTLEKILDNQL
jgi:hypothetical protein